MVLAGPLQIVNAELLALSPLELTRVARFVWGFLASCFKIDRACVRIGPSPQTVGLKIGPLYRISIYFMWIGVEFLCQHTLFSFELGCAFDFLYLRFCGGKEESDKLKRVTKKWIKRERKNATKLLLGSNSIPRSTCTHTASLSHTHTHSHTIRHHSPETEKITVEKLLNRKSQRRHRP